METKKRDELIELFDIYHELLTTKQNEYFTQYYLDDLSISEIAENFSISRNGIFDQIKKACAIIENYESKLGINARNKKIKEVLKLEDLKKLKEEIKIIIEE